jgi:hypothetical protein
MLHDARRVVAGAYLTVAFASLLHRRMRCKVAPAHSLALLRLLHSLRRWPQRVSELENCAFPHILLEETLEGNLKDIFDQIHVSEYPLEYPVSTQRAPNEYLQVPMSTP